MGYIYSKVKDAVREKSKFYECISFRYGLSYCLLLIFTNEKEDITPTLLANIRCADNLIKIDDNLYALFFFANRDDSFVKVANKILYVLEKSYPGSKFSIGVACKEAQDDVVSRSIQNLLRAKDSQYSAIVDEF